MDLLLVEYAGGVAYTNGAVSGGVAATRHILLDSDLPTIIFGAAHQGEDSSPSIAVVASQDWPEARKCAGFVCAQAHCQELIQIFLKYGNFLSRFVEQLDRILSIIYFKGNISGQFYQVLLYELDVIRKACASLKPNYQPPVTFVVLKNVTTQGTVVDSKIFHPTEFDFYLRSHAVGDLKLLNPENKAFAQIYQKSNAGKILECHLNLLNVIRVDGYLPDRVINLIL
ncbi:hypothetical protein C5167_027560 [Papaver somniferum]|nr:hypothetical protein C5167_027560 [Papaver somniferum]